MAAYIKFDGVDGESKAAGNEKWSDLESFGQAIHKSGSGDNRCCSPTRDGSFGRHSVLQADGQILA